jgi:hypothetical protein
MLFYRFQGNKKLLLDLTVTVPFENQPDDLTLPLRYFIGFKKCGKICFSLLPRDGSGRIIQV